MKKKAKKPAAKKRVKKVPVKKAAARKPARKPAPPKKAKRNMSPAPPGVAPSTLVDERIASLSDWRGAMLAKLRALIHEEDPAVVEAWKWGIPVWEHDGILCTGETYKAAVKLTFAHGASLPDPAKVFNSSLEGNMRRAVDFREGNTVNEGAFKALIRAAIDFNAMKKK